MQTKTPLFACAISPKPLLVAFVAFGVTATGCSKLPPGILTPGNLSGGAAAGPGLSAPVVYPTPPVPPATPPDLILPPPSGAANPITLQPPADSGPTGPGYGGGTQPVPYPGGGGGPVTASPVPSTGQGSFLRDQEAIVLQLTNQARAQAGLGALAQTAPLTTIAEGRSQDMGTRNYFSHVTPEGQTVFNFLAQAGISYTAAGENIAMNSAPANQTAQTAFTAWMSDQGHKANILDPAYGHIGIGVYQTSGGLSYLTQDFTN